MFTSFDAYKVLFQINKLKELANNNIPTPCKVDIDLTNTCNHSCFFCNSAYCKHQSGYAMLAYDHIINIIDTILIHWSDSLKALCFAGGGEPFTHPDASRIFQYVSSKWGDIEYSVVTNGSLLTNHDCQVLSDGARYVGISFESATSGTHKLIRNTNDHSIILRNIKHLCSLLNTGKMTDVCVKVLVNHYNYSELYELSKICLDLGVTSMHIRPVGIDNVLDKSGNIIGTNYNLKKYKDKILDQYSKIETLKTDTFNPVIVSHMFGDDMERILPFNTCRATPLSSLCFSADGTCYICINNRGNESFKLGMHNPDPLNIINLWGSSHHHNLIDNINPNKCMRCTQIFANTFIEEAIIKDNMYRNFI